MKERKLTIREGKIMQFRPEHFLSVCTFIAKGEEKTWTRLLLTLLLGKLKTETDVRLLKEPVLKLHMNNPREWVCS